MKLWKRGLQWPLAMALILSLTVGANIWVMRVAGSDPSFVVEKNYYAKAVQWDSTMAQERRNAELGWKVVPQFRSFSSDSGAMLQVDVSDASGAAISDAMVRVAALHNARASDIHESTLNAASDGGYEARLPVTMRGQWELRFEIVRGSDRFTAVARVEAVPGAP